MWVVRSGVWGLRSLRRVVSEKPAVWWSMTYGSGICSVACEDLKIWAVGVGCSHCSVACEDLKIWAVGVGCTHYSVACEDLKS